MDDVEQRVRGIVARKFGVDASALSKDLHFANDLSADSLDAVELVLMLEHELGIDIPDEEIAEIETLREAIAAVAILVEDLHPWHEKHTRINRPLAQISRR